MKTWYVLILKLFLYIVIVLVQKPKYYFSSCCSKIITSEWFVGGPLIQ